MCHPGGKSGCRDMQETIANAVSFIQLGICDSRLEKHYLMIPGFEDCVSLQICTKSFLLIKKNKRRTLLSV